MDIREVNEIIQTANKFIQQYETTGELEFLDKAYTHANSIYDSSIFNNLSDEGQAYILDINAYLSIKKYHSNGQLNYLEDAVGYAKKAVELTPDNHPYKAGALNNLVNMLNNRFDRIGNIQDLEDAVGYAKKAVELTPDNHPDNAMCLTTLANILSDRFDRIGNIQDLENAVVYAKKAVELMPDNHPDKAKYLNNLSLVLGVRFNRIGNIQDLEDAVRYVKKAVELTPDNHPDKAMFLTTLASRLYNRFNRIGNIQDLEDAVMYAKKAIDLTPDNHLYKAGRLNNLANRLSDRFNQIGNIQDLEDAVVYAKKAVDLTPDNNPYKALFLNTLSITLSIRFRRIGNIQDLEDAVVCEKKAIELTPSNHPDIAHKLNNLATMINDRFIRIGNIQDLEDAIVYAIKAVDLTPDKHPEKAMYLYTLANSLNDRFIRIGNIQDLEDAVGYAKKTVDLTPDNNPDKAGRLNSLATMLNDRFNRIGNIQDLEDAVGYAKKAVDLTPDNNPYKARRFNTLSIILRNRFNQIRNIQDLEDTVGYAKKAVDLTPDNNPYKAIRLNTLANMLSDRFKQIGNVQDLEDAVGYAKKTIELTPDNHPYKAMWFNNLATMLNDRFKQIGNIQDLKDAIGFYNRILNQKDYLNPEVLLKVARSLGKIYLNQQKWELALQSYQIGKYKIDTLVFQHVLRSSKEAWMKEAQGFPDLMAYALGKLDRKEEALLALENGRARLLSTQLIRKNINIDILQSKDKNLAQEYLDVISKIRVLQKKELKTGQEYKKLQEDLTNENKILMDTVDRIKKIPSFESFLEEMSKEKIVKAAQTAPLIYLATTSNGTLVLIVQMEGKIISNWFDTLSVDILREKLFGPENSDSKGGYFETYLKWKTTPRIGTPNHILLSIRQAWFDSLVGLTKWLWDELMGDIVEYLKDNGYKQAVLLPGGLLGLLPLYTAWTNDGTQISKKRYAMDDILFTYAPNTQALLNAQENKNREDKLVLIVDNPDGTLRFSNAEAEAVKEYFDDDNVLHLEKDQATFDEITKNASKYNILHFSTHGGVNYFNPLNSGLLTAHEKQPLQLRNILQLDLENVRLAVLSACDTGVPGLSLLDEVISLPTGCLQAGIPGIVSSLWSVSDCSTMILMERFYYFWKKDKQPIAYALRSAQQWVRDTPNAEITEHFKKWLSEETLGELGIRMSENAAIGIYADLNRMDDDGFQHPYYWAAFGFTGV